MKRRHIGLVSAVGVAGAVLSMSTASFADGTTVAQAPAPVQPTYTGPAYGGPTYAGPRGPEHIYTRPNGPLITSGLFTFGAAYVPAVIVAGESSRAADRNLYIPVAGPWIDMANRQACGREGGPSCGAETTNKVLLGVSGVAQGAGAAMTLLGLFTSERHDVAPVAAHADKPTIQVSPASVGSGYGIGAVGTW
jgi:hypothetical protein